MTDEPALLAAVAVAAAPDDDTPRLFYADWVDDHGRPERAEFVRVQCRLAALAAAPQLRGLVCLDGWTNPIADAAPLLDPATFPRLADYKLNGNKLSPAAVKTLTARRGGAAYNQFA